MAALGKTPDPRSNEIFTQVSEGQRRAGGSIAPQASSAEAPIDEADHDGVVDMVTRLGGGAHRAAPATEQSGPG
jgi:hypothetical protein